MTKTLWLIRSIGGDTVEMCPGGREPYWNGVIAEVPYKLTRAMGVTGLRKGEAREVAITTTTSWYSKELTREALNDD